jgi:hypothetical protein
MRAGSWGGLRDFAGSFVIVHSVCASASDYCDRGRICGYYVAVESASASGGQNVTPQSVMGRAASARGRPRS